MEDKKIYTDVFFDLDHTIWDFETNSHQALKDMFLENGLEKTINNSFENFFEKYTHHNKIMWQRYQNGFVSRDDLRWKRMWRTLLEFKIANEQLAGKIAEEYLHILPTKTNLFEGTIEILEYLKNKNYQLHIITNGFEKTQWLKINNSGIANYFSKVITSESSNSLKPKKEIFEYAVDQASTTIAKSIMIGDNLDADIQGAVNAGMDSIFVNHINEDNRNLPKYTVANLLEIQSILY